MKTLNAQNAQRAKNKSKDGHPKIIATRRDTRPTTPHNSLPHSTAPSTNTTPQISPATKQRINRMNVSGINTQFSNELGMYSDSSSEEGSDCYEHQPQNVSSLGMLLELSYSGLPETSRDEIDSPVEELQSIQVKVETAISSDQEEECKEIDATPKIANTRTVNDCGSECEYNEEMKVINEFLRKHNEKRTVCNDHGDESIGTHVTMDTEDYIMYMQTNASSPNAIRSTFLHCLRENDVDLADRILRDIGIEYILRHCLLYDGIFTAQSESEENDPTTTTRTSSANMFWLAAFYGSADVLDLIIEECWVYFIEEETGGDIEPSEEVKKRATGFLSVLLNKNVSVYGCTPLFIAAAQNHANVVAVLLNYSVDQNEENGNGTTAAIAAASRNNLKALEALGNSKATDFNKANKNGTTPLLAACRYGAVDAVRFLNHFPGDGDEPVVDCTVQDGNGFGCAALAAKYNQFNVIQFLCQAHAPGKFGVDINQQTREGRDTALHIAAWYGSRDTVRSFLEMIPRDCDEYARNRSGMTALHIASSRGKGDIVKEFVSALSKDDIAGLDTVDAIGMTPLFYGKFHHDPCCKTHAHFHLHSLPFRSTAAWRGYADIVKLLAPLSDANKLCRVPVSKNRDAASEDALTNKKLTTVQKPALIAAVNRGHIDIIYTLLYCGADPNITDNKGQTPLSYAAKDGHLEIVEILVNHGADVKIRSKGGRMPIHKARKYKHHEVVDYLENCVS